MKIHLACYADDPFRPAQRRLVASTAGRGVDAVHAFGPADLRDTAFYRAHRDILDQPRGGGYWLWKPFLIMKVLREAAAGDVVLYADSGSTVLAPVTPLAAVCRSAGGLLLFRNHARQNRYWTKRDAYVAAGCDHEACYAADQVNAAFSVWEAGSEAAWSFLEAWLELCTDAQLITDSPSKCGLPELDDYITHLHDQSLASLLAFNRSVQLYRDPSQFGNHCKPPALRVPGEQLDLPYAAEPCERSQYATLFDHHRQGTRPPGPTGRLVGAVKSAVRRFVPKEWPNPYFSADDLEAAIARDRATLATVPRWFDPAAEGSAQFGYGVSPDTRALLDRPVGRQPTVPDLIGHLSDALGERLNYLELGVSVGKNFYQLLRAGKGRKLTGFDIEEMHPNLTSRLTRTDRVEWPSSAGSLKRGASSLTTLSDPAGGNEVRYLAGDVFDEGCWSRLRGRPFNFIFSDALHRPEGLMYEWRMIRRFDLLDPGEFVMIWDDLGGYMSLAFDRIAQQAAKWAGGCGKLTFRMRGWMGVNEYPHQIGLIFKLRNPPAWLGRADKRTARRMSL